MKRLAAIACLMTLAWNTALGSIGGILFCEHEDGSKHWTSKVAHAQEAHKNCSHSNQTSLSERVFFGATGHSCTDIEIKAKDLKGISRNFNRTTFKVPLIIVWAGITQRITLPEARFAKELQSTRVPLVIRTTTLQFTDTVQFLC